MVKYQPPIAHVVESIKVEETIRTTIELTELPSAPIAPALIYSKTEPPELLFELHRLVDRTEKSLVFITYYVDKSPLIAGQSYDFYAQWTPEQLELAQDDTRQWRKELFANKEMITFKVKDGGTIGRKIKEGEDTKGGVVIPGGWDHEHCELCHETISAAEGHPHYGFTDGKEWVCEVCYEKYILSGFGKKLGDAG
jgi:hypothetical protein